MAANTFATMLHKSSPKMGVLLVYSLLEWVLIGLLLLNALFSYLISRFAHYFGLKPPCLLCSRVDHLFEPSGAPRKSYTDLLCNDHVAEISRLGFCSRHQKVPEGSGGFCSECCSECGSGSPHAAEEELKCCCCGAPVGLETLDDSVRTDEVFGDSLYSQITVTFRGEEGGHREIRHGDVIVILDENEEEGEDRQNHDEEKGDEVVVEGQGDGDATGEGDVDASGEGDFDATGEREADEVVSTAPSYSSDQYHRVYGADFYVKLLSQCRECGTIMEEKLVPAASVDQNATGSENLHWSEAQGLADLSPEDNLPGPSFVAEASSGQKEALDSSLVFFHTRESGDATVDCSLVTTVDIFFDNQDLHNQKTFSSEKAHLISVDSIATKEYTVVAKEITIAAASEDFDQIDHETKLKRISVSEGISEQKPVQVVHTLDCLVHPTGIYIETQDKSQEIDEDNETDGDVSIRTDVTEDHIYGIQNPELFQPLLDHISDDNGKADSEKSCEVSIGSEICEQEHPVPLQVHESHSSLAYQEEIELKHTIEEGDEGTERNGETDNVCSQEGSLKKICNQEHSFSQIRDTLPPLNIPLILSAGSVSESEAIEVQEHKEIYNTRPPSAIQIPQSSDINNASEVNDQTEIAKAITEGDRVGFEETGNIRIEASCEIPLSNQSNDGQMVDSSKHPEGFKEAAEEISSQEGYSRIEISAKIIETSRSMDHVENHHRHTHPEDNEMEEEKAPETPNSEEGIQNLHTRLVFDRRDHATESVDGSVASEMDGGEPLTLEHLKAALKTERNALRSLYAELEEERSASAIAANQTMAMITRLQEEKASMQMEALQYQRMMEEQTEYDQEALQMLNELVMMREKEKQELEQELEKYRKKLEHYENSKRRRSGKMANGQNGFDSGMSDGNDSDVHSYNSDEEEQDIYDTPKEHKTSAEVMLHSAIDQEAVKNLVSLDESLDDFEEERRSILVQLKMLEEKLYVSDDDVASSRKRKHSDDFADEHINALDETDEPRNSVATGFSSGLSDDLVSDDKETSRRHLPSGGKRLLPLFDAAASDDMEGSQQEQPESPDGSPVSASKTNIKPNRVAIAEEVDHVYERLSALEADREFLKHCIRSLKNGDRGIKLLQEILQHLRDLKHAELQPPNSDVGSGTPSDLNLES